MTTQHDADQREFEAWQVYVDWRECDAHGAWHASRAALRAQQCEATDMEIAEVLAPVQAEWQGGGVMWMVPAVAAFRQGLARLGLRVVRLGGGE